MIALAADFSGRMLAQYRQRGFGAVRPVHGAVLRNLGLTGTRVTVLAARAGITHRAMAKILAEVVALGFVSRRPDPRDRRASLVEFTPLGLRLLEISSGIIEGIYADYSARVGASALEQLERCLYDALVGLNIEVTSSGQQALHSSRPESRGGPSEIYLSHNLGRYLQLAAGDYHRRCAMLMAASGHPSIRFDRLAVFSHLGLSGMTLTELAKSANISLQAMGKQVRAVLKLNYIEMLTDSDDRRIRQVWFTTLGRRFLRDLLQTFEQIDRDYAQLLGEQRARHLQDSLATVVAALGLEVPVRTPITWQSRSG